MKKLTMVFLAAIFALVTVNVVYAADYVGVKKCKMCHMKEYKSWESTKMAKAFESLKPGVAAEAKKAAGLDADKDYTTDASCLGCHAVNGKADMPGVECESCHGAGSDFMKVMMTNRDYTKADITAAGLVAPNESTCKKCHNEKSPFFKGFTFDANKGIHEHFPLKKQH
jgi:hypothetical protein